MAAIIGTDVWTLLSIVPVPVSTCKFYNDLRDCVYDLAQLPNSYALRRPQSRRKPNRQLELHVLGIWRGFLAHLHVCRLSRLILDKIPCVGSILFLGQLFLLCVLNWRLQCRSFASSTHLLPVLLRWHVCSDLGLLRRVLVQSPARKLAESLSDDCLISSQLQLLVQREYGN
jgi:hypothetical protein